MHAAGTLDELQSLIKSNHISCKEVVQRYLHTIKEKNGHYNAFLEIFEQEALEKAKIIDDKFSKKTQGSLAGLIIGIKDNICYKNHKVSAASKILENFTAPYSATVVSRLVEQDAIIIGRLNCDEFAMGSSNQNSAFGGVPNPYSPKHCAGGSSGGSAVAVATQMCMASLGSDTGGSVRLPASFCNIFGYKPSYGRLSRYGLIAFASSFDQIGVFAHTIDTIIKINEIVAGEDAMDPTSSRRTITKFSQEKFPKKLRIAVLSEHEHKLNFLQKEVSDKLDSSIEQLKESGHTVDTLAFPYQKYITPCYHILSTAEAASNLARYDGVRFGVRTSEAASIEEVYTKSRTQGFGKEVKRRIMFGNFVLRSSHKSGYYTQAQKFRRLLCDFLDKIFQNYDLILSPTSATTAFPIQKGNLKINPTSIKQNDVYTAMANLTGTPAVSIPSGFSTDHLPIGLQLIARPFSDHLVFQGAKLLNEITGQ